MSQPQWNQLRLAVAKPSVLNFPEPQPDQESWIVPGLGVFPASVKRIILHGNGTMTVYERPEPTPAQHSNPSDT